MVANPKQGLDGRVNSSLPGSRECGIVCVCKTGVLDQVLEKTVRSTSPSLWGKVSDPMDVVGKDLTYYISANRFTRGWVQGLGGKAWQWCSDTQSMLYCFLSQLTVSIVSSVFSQCAEL